MDDPGEDSMMLSSTPAGAAAHHNCRRRPRPGSPAPESESEEGGGGSDGGGLLAMKRQMVLDTRATGGARSFGVPPPAGTTAAMIPAAAALTPFGRPSSPYCAAADLAAAASALSMSGGGSSPEDEPGRVLVPAVCGAEGWGGSPSLVLRCEWVPGPGSGRVHVVATPIPTAMLPPGRGASEVAALQEAARVAHSFLRLWGPRELDHLDRLTGMDAVVRFERPPHAAHLEQQPQQLRRKSSGHVYLMTSPDAHLLVGMGPGILLALLQLLTRLQPCGPQVRLRPRVAVLGELTLEGRLVATSRPSPTMRPLPSLVPRVHAALASGAVDCVVLPREAQEEVARAGLAAAVDPGALRYVDDVRGLLAAALEGDEAVHAWAPAPQCSSSSGGGGSSSGSHARRLFVAPTLLPEGPVSVALRCVEACALPRPRGTQSGRFIITGLPHVPSSGGMGLGMGLGGSSSDGSGSSGSSNSARAALNTARFLLLKHQGDIARLLGPPAVDLRVMRLLVASDDPAAGNAAAAAAAGGMDTSSSSLVGGVPIDIHLHLPQALPSPAYGLPALLALVAVAWPHARESLEGIASLGEVNAVGALGLHERLRPTFVAALTACGARKIVLPCAQARELVREEGGGVGDRWLLQSGAMVQGAERVLDVVRACFLGDDGL